jgi:hypothetical protein
MTLLIKYTAGIKAPQKFEGSGKERKSESRGNAG